jgi:cell division protein FtsQ
VTVVDGGDQHPAAGIDPRIRARRIAVARDAGRRRLRRLSVVAAMLSLLPAGWLISRSPLLDVDRIAVEGAARSGTEAVREAAGIADGAPLLEVDLGEVEARVEALPWVADAEVSRHPPGEVHIAVEERSPAALIAAGGALALVDPSGRVLDTVASAPAGLVTVEGLDALPAPGDEVPRALRAALAVAVDVAAALEDQARAVRDTGVGLEVVLADGGVALLGSDDDLAAKLVAVVAVLDQVERGCLGRVDVRVPTSPVLTRDARCG